MAESMWGEVKTLYMETAALVPAVLSGLEKPTVLAVSPATINASSFQNFNSKQQIVISISVVNSVNVPTNFQVTMSGKLQGFSGNAVVLFEQSRQIKITNGVINDFINGYGSRTYSITLTSSSSSSSSPSANLINNPSFEDQSSAGVADGYRMSIATTGSTILCDPLVYFDGDFSLRFTSNSNGGMTLYAYPVAVNSTLLYRISLWAKSRDSGAVIFVQQKAIVLSNVWQSFSIYYSPSSSSNQSITVSLQMLGVVWIDLMEMQVDTSKHPSQDIIH